MKNKLIRNIVAGLAGLAGLVMAGCITVTDAKTGDKTYITMDPVSSIIVDTFFVDGRKETPNMATPEQEYYAKYDGKAQVRTSKTLGTVVYTTCESIKETNRNGVPDPEDEFIGVSNTFWSGKRFTLWLRHPDVAAPAGMTMHTLRDGDEVSAEEYKEGSKGIRIEKIMNDLPGAYELRFNDTKNELVLSIGYAVRR